MKPFARNTGPASPAPPTSLKKTALLALRLRRLEQARRRALSRLRSIRSGLVFCRSGGNANPRSTPAKANHRSPAESPGFFPLCGCSDGPVSPWDFSGERGAFIRNRNCNAAYTQLFCSLVFALITGVLWLICGALPGFSRKLMGLDAGLSFCCGLFLLYVPAFPMGARAGAPDLLLVMTLLFLIAVFLLYYFTFHIFKTSNSKGE